jgi:hypothetical protein
MSNANLPAIANKATKLSNRRFSTISNNLLRNSQFIVSPDGDSTQQRLVPDDWALMVKANWQLSTNVVNTTALPQTELLKDRATIFQIKAQTNSDDRLLSQLRQIIKIETYPDNATFRASLCLRQISKTPTPLLLGLFADEQLTQRIYQKSVLAEPTEDWLTIDLSIDLKQVAPNAPQTLYAVFQIGIPNQTEIWLLSASLNAIDREDDFQPIDFCFSAFGDYSKASARLRVWKLANCLQRAGHSVVTKPSPDCDIYVCQKVRPFEQVKALAAKNTLIVYDFDDNYSLPTQGTEADLVAFMNLVDVVTVGSEFLAEFARKYHPNVFVLPNPVDIISDTVYRQPKPELNRIGWFGAPEGLAQLDLVKINEPITTITKGGDLEFNIDRVDRTLTEFDLLLFPLEPTEWNLAKNANRAIKAIALGIPVLATATPEHIKVFTELGLGRHFLVDYNGDWGEKIAYLRDRYAEIQAEILQARQRALELYSVEKIAKDWFYHLIDSPKRSKLKIAKDKFANLQSLRKPANFPEIGLVIYNYSSSKNFDNTFLDSEVNWQDFGSKYAINAAPYDNLAVEAEGCGFQYFEVKNDYLELFSYLDRAIAEMSEEWILFLSADYTLVYGLYAELEKHLLNREDRPDVLLLNSQPYGGTSDSWVTNQMEMTRWIWELNAPGALLVRRTWLRQNLPSTLSLMSYWTWYIVFKALSDPNTDYRRTNIPVAIRHSKLKAQDLSSEYSRWLSLVDKKVTTDLPNAATQWQRITHDIIGHAIDEFPLLLPPTIAKGIELLQSRNAEVDKLKEELKRTKSRLSTLEQELNLKTKA